MTEFCPNCRAPRTGNFRYCRSCGFDYDTATVGPGAPVPPPTDAPMPDATQPAVAPGPTTDGGSTQQNLAGGLLEIENLRVKLVIGRLVGVVAGIAILWFFVGPALEDNVGLLLVMLVVLPFAGLFVGNYVTLWLLSGRR